MPDGPWNDYQPTAAEADGPWNDFKPQGQQGWWDNTKGFLGDFMRMPVYATGQALASVPRGLSGLGQVIAGGVRTGAISPFAFGLGGVYSPSASDFLPPELDYRPGAGAIRRGLSKAALPVEQGFSDASTYWGKKQEGMRAKTGAGQFLQDLAEVPINVGKYAIPYIGQAAFVGDVAGGSAANRLPQGADVSTLTAADYLPAAISGAGGGAAMLAGGKVGGWIFNKAAGRYVPLLLEGATNKVLPTLVGGATKGAIQGAVFSPLTNAAEYAANPEAGYHPLAGIGHHMLGFAEYGAAGHLMARPGAPPSETGLRTTGPPPLEGEIMPPEQPSGALGQATPVLGWEHPANSLRMRAYDQVAVESKGLEIARAQLRLALESGGPDGEHVQDAQRQMVWAENRLRHAMVNLHAQIGREMPTTDLNQKGSVQRDQAPGARAEDAKPIEPLGAPGRPRPMPGQNLGLETIPEPLRPAESPIRPPTGMPEGIQQVRPTLPGARPMDMQGWPPTLDQGGPHEGPEASLATRPEESAATPPIGQGPQPDAGRYPASNTAADRESGLRTPEEPGGGEPGRGLDSTPVDAVGGPRGHEEHRETPGTGTPEVPKIVRVEHPLDEHGHLTQEGEQALTHNMGLAARDRDTLRSIYENHPDTYGGRLLAIDKLYEILAEDTNVSGHESLVSPKNGVLSTRLATTFRDYTRGVYRQHAGSKGFILYGPNAAGKSQIGRMILEKDQNAVVHESGNPARDLPGTLGVMRASGLASPKIVVPLSSPRIAAQGLASRSMDIGRYIQSENFGGNFGKYARLLDQINAGRISPNSLLVMNMFDGKMYSGDRAVAMLGKAHELFTQAGGMAGATELARQSYTNAIENAPNEAHRNALERNAAIPSERQGIVDRQAKEIETRKAAATETQPQEPSKEPAPTYSQLRDERNQLITKRNQLEDASGNPTKGNEATWADLNRQIKENSAAIKEARAREAQQENSPSGERRKGEAGFIDITDIHMAADKVKETMGRIGTLIAGGAKHAKDMVLNRSEMTQQDIWDAIKKLNQRGESIARGWDRMKISVNDRMDALTQALLANTYGKAAHDENGVPIMPPSWMDQGTPDVAKDLPNGALGLLRKLWTKVGSQEVVLGRGLFGEAFKNNVTPIIDYMAQQMRRQMVIKNYGQYLSEAMAGIQNQSRAVRSKFNDLFFNHMKQDSNLKKVEDSLGDHIDLKEYDRLTRAMEKGDEVSQDVLREARDELVKDDATHKLLAKREKILQEIQQINLRRQEALLDSARKYADSRVYLLAEKGAERIKEMLDRNGPINLRFGKDRDGKDINVEVSRGEAEVARRVAEIMGRMREELRTAGVPVREGGYMHRAYRGRKGLLSWGQERELEDMKALPGYGKDVPSDLEAEDIRFAHRDSNNRTWFPSTYASVENYVPMFAQKLTFREWANKWVDGWAKENAHQYPNLAHVVQEVANSYRGQSQDTLSRLINQATALFYMKHIGGSVTVAVKHAAKAAFTPIRYGMVSTAEGGSNLLHAYLGKTIRTAEDRGWLDLGDQNEFINKARAKSAALDAYLSSRYIDRAVELYTGTEMGEVNSWAGRVLKAVVHNPVNAVEAFDRGLTFFTHMASIAHGEGMTGHEAADLRNAMASTLAVNFMGFDRGTATMNPLWRAFMPFTQAPTHLVEHAAANFKNLIMGDKNAEGRSWMLRKMFGDNAPIRQIESRLEAVRYFTALGIVKGVLDKLWDTDITGFLLHPPKWMSWPMNTLMAMAGFKPYPFEPHIGSGSVVPMGQETLDNIRKYGLGKEAAAASVLPDLAMKAKEFSAGLPSDKQGKYGPRGSAEQATRYWTGQPRRSVVESQQERTQKRQESEQRRNRNYYDKRYSLQPDVSGWRQNASQSD